jgi:hypothetical protein
MSYTYEIRFWDLPLRTKIPPRLCSNNVKSPFSLAIEGVLEISVVCHNIPYGFNCYFASVKHHKAYFRPRHSPPLTVVPIGPSSRWINIPWAFIYTELSSAFAIIFTEHNMEISRFDVASNRDLHI